MAEMVSGDGKTAVRGMVAEEVERARVEGRRLGALTNYGANLGYVAFMPSRAFGRIIFEATGRLNDALREMEVASVAYASDMDLSDWQEYQRTVDGQLTAIKAEMEKMVVLCGYGVRGEYKEGAKFGKKESGNRQGGVSGATG